MGPELLIAAAALFVSGGAIGTAGTLLTQWVFKRLGEGDAAERSLDERDLAGLRAEVADVTRRLYNIDARLDFQEQLLAGSTPAVAPPPRLAVPEEGDERV
jgi:hypothetical protein